MSTLDNPEIADIVSKISDLYLNESFSDVVFVVDGERLPAHQNILSQRCPAFKSMFSSINSREIQTLKVSKTSVDAFKLFLKFIYTGTIELDTANVETIFNLLRLSSNYEMPRLTHICEEQLKKYMDTNADQKHTVAMINAIVEKLQEGHVDKYFDRFRPCFPDLIQHESFKTFSVKALHRILKDEALEKLQEDVFEAFVGWMTANPSASEHFPEFLKHIDITNMAIDEVVYAIESSKLIDAKILVDIVYEQSKKAKYPDGNVLVAENKIKVVTGGTSNFFTVAVEGSTLKHEIGKKDGYITINLKRLYMLNYIEMELADGDWSYWIEVSEDNANWTRIIDYSKYVCRSVQRLYFKERPVRYIRIYGTAPADATFEVLRLEAYHKAQQLKIDPETGIVEPSENIALAEKNAVVIQGSSDSSAMLTGMGAKEALHIVGIDSIIVQLPQPYLVDTICLFLSRSLYNKAVYSYTIEVSTDKTNWTQVFSEEDVYWWRYATFDKQPVVFIKLTGTDGPDDKFRCKVFECPNFG